MINEAESLSISFADYIGYCVSTASTPTGTGTHPFTTRCFTFGNQFIMSYATGHWQLITCQLCQTCHVHGRGRGNNT